jgi:Tfp pilus assembly protein PilV
MRPAARTRERGATLLETSMAVGLLAIAALGIGHVTIGMQRANKASHNATIAATAAADKLEELRLVPVQKMANGADAIAMPDHPNWTFERSWTVTDSDTTHPDVPLGTRRVDVAVSWVDYKKHEVVMSTLMHLTE